MKKIFFLALILSGLDIHRSFAQKCVRNITVEEWINDPAISSLKAFQDMVAILPDNMLCYAKVDQQYFLMFYDSIGQEHLVLASEKNFDEFIVAVSEKDSDLPVFSATFVLNGPDNSHKILTYNRSPLIVNAPFRNFVEYWNMYFPKKELTHQ